MSVEVSSGRRRRPYGDAAARDFPGRLALVLGAGFAITLIRAWGRLAHPTLRSEDGPIFLKQAREDGLRAIFELYRGYLHLLPRLVALAWRELPLTWQPGLYAWSAVLIGFALSSMALSARMSWLLPHRWQREALFLLLVAGAARDEVTGNIANLIFVGALGLLFVALRTDSASRGVAVSEAVLVAVLAMSGPGAVFLAPAFLLRAWRLRSRQSYALVGIVAIATVIQWGTLVINPRTSDSSGSPSVWAGYLGRRAFTAAWFGANHLSALWHGWWPLLILATVALVFVLAVVVWHSPDRLAFAALGAGFLMATLVPCLAYYFMAESDRAQRHLLLPLTIITIVLLSGLAQLRRPVRVLAAVALALMLIAIGRDFVLSSLPFKPIGPAAACLATGHAPCQIHSNTSEWDFTLDH